MTVASSAPIFRDAMVNYYVYDVEGLAAFYAHHAHHFGFLETPPLRAVWVEDPEGNPIQKVCIRK